MSLLFAAALAALPVFAEQAAPPASPEVVQSVEEFIKTPVVNLPADSIEGFLRVDPKTLPKKDQAPYEARRLELYTLKQLVESKKKGMIRMMEKECVIPEDTKTMTAAGYKMAGFGELLPDDVPCCVERTHCTEKELMCEFTLRQVVETDKKGEKKVRWFLNPSDPLMAIVTACRHKAGGNTNFFGAMTPTCTH